MLNSKKKKQTKKSKEKEKVPGAPRVATPAHGPTATTTTSQNSKSGKNSSLPTPGPSGKAKSPSGVSNGNAKEKIKATPVVKPIPGKSDSCSSLNNKNGIDKEISADAAVPSPNGDSGPAEMKIVLTSPENEGSQLGSNGSHENAVPERDRNLDPNFLHTKNPPHSDEEESSSTEIWCDAREDGAGSEDSSLRAVSALSSATYFSSLEEMSGADNLLNVISEVKNSVEIEAEVSCCSTVDGEDDTLTTSENSDLPLDVSTSSENATTLNQTANSVLETEEVLVIQIQSPSPEEMENGEASPDPNPSEQVLSPQYDNIVQDEDTSAILQESIYDKPVDSSQGNNDAQEIDNLKNNSNNGSTDDAEILDLHDLEAQQEPIETFKETEMPAEVQRTPTNSVSFEKSGLEVIPIEDNSSEVFEESERKDLVPGELNGSVCNSIAGESGQQGRGSISSGRRSSLARSVCEEAPESPGTAGSIVDYLCDVQTGAEARLAARRQARAEAREIRMKELEKQQKESEETADKHFDMYSTDVVNRAAFRVALGSHRTHSVGSASYHSSRRSSEDSSEDGMINIRDLRHDLKELEDKFRKAMVQNAQLDNEKSALTYHVELLKDKIEDLEESLTQLQREHKEKSREYENLKRLSTQLKDELEYFKFQLQERNDLIREYGLVVVESEIQVDLGNGDRETRISKALVTSETADVLNNLGDGSLDVRLKKVIEEKNELLDEIRRLKLDLEEERNQNSKGDRYNHHNNISNSNPTVNGPDSDTLEIQRESSKLMSEYKFKVQKYEQEIVTLQANVARLDSQVTRYKTSSEDAESREDDLKVEKRKLQRELREAQSRLDELETTNSHLQKRLDKLKTAKSTLLKEL